MAVELNPYLNFRDKTREAMTFYKSVFGGELNMQTYKQFHASEDPAEDEKIMHAELTADHVKLFAADTPNRMDFKPGTNFSLSVSGDDEETLKHYFDKLSEGGKVTMPLEKAAWGDQFGMCDDKFGVHWMVNISAKD